MSQNYFHSLEQEDFPAAKTAEEIEQMRNVSTSALCLLLGDRAVPCRLSHLQRCFEGTF